MTKREEINHNTATIKHLEERIKELELYIYDRICMVDFILQSHCKSEVTTQDIADFINLPAEEVKKMSSKIRHTAITYINYINGCFFINRKFH